MKEHGNNLDFDILAKMDELHFAVKEALRMHPPLIMLLRMAQVPFDVETSDGKKYTIPKGHIVATSPAFAHRLENVYSDPDVYNPGRFREPNPEDKAAFASFIGFGGGRHGCMGETFAYMQIKTIWSVLLRNFDFELVGNLPEPDYEGMVVGPKSRACATSVARSSNIIHLTIHRSRRITARAHPSSLPLPPSALPTPLSPSSPLLSSPLSSRRPSPPPPTTRHENETKETNHPHTHTRAHHHASSESTRPRRPRARVSREHRARARPRVRAVHVRAVPRARSSRRVALARVVALARALRERSRRDGKEGRRHPSHAPVRAEELRYDRVAVEDASRALEPGRSGTLRDAAEGVAEREAASWDDAQAKAVDEMFASYDSERKYVRGSGMLDAGGRLARSRRTGRGAGRGRGGDGQEGPGRGRGGGCGRSEHASRLGPCETPPMELPHGEADQRRWRGCGWRRARASTR